MARKREQLAEQMRAVFEEEQRAPLTRVKVERTSTTADQHRGYTLARRTQVDRTAAGDWARLKLLGIEGFDGVRDLLKPVRMDPGVRLVLLLSRSLRRLETPRASVLDCHIFREAGYEPL
ncbi:MAG: hypothetical protein GDA49_10490 [Rhodospirillales bacterium]|nr:hypothetical protein [Rhodospirillales bacterium]